jgi:glycosyltransferase involved in cell wall biosynthesis
MISVVVLTFNCERSIGRTLRSLQPISDDIHVVDSFSTDRTLEICKEFDCSTVQHAFSTYADQRNWAIDTLALKYSWQLHVDADEELEPELIDRLRQLDLRATDYDGFILGRKIVVLGRVLRFGGIAKTWHCRLFRNGKGRCEQRLYDQHFLCSGKIGVIDAFMRDHQEGSLSHWTIQHNRWSDLEVAEIVGGDRRGKQDQVTPKLRGTMIERKRLYKNSYYRLPLFIRALLYFCYRYIVLFGFLDGREGLIFHVLQAFWFRFLVDAKIYETFYRRRHNL